MVPQELRYTAEHEWARAADDGSVRVGITDFAQQALGDIVYVSLPATGTQLSAGQVIGEVESTKSVSEIYAPFGGEVVGRNEALQNEPDLLNRDPYGEGWIVAMRPASASDLDALLDAGAYQEQIDSAS